MILACIAAAIFSQTAQDRQVTPPQFLPDPDGRPHLTLLPNRDPLSPPKIAPLKSDDPKLDLTFPYVVAGFENLDTLSAGDGSYHIRLRVFAQDQATQLGLATQTARMLMRLWQMAYVRLGIDHSEQYNARIVDVYLCRGGKPGGEQLFAEDSEGGRPKKVDTIYIYDVASFTDPVEEAREVAHEYGHAILPAIGGFVKPERWANGYLGEKLFLTWVQEDLESKRLEPSDTMGATSVALRPWLDTNVAQLVQASATRRPDATALSRTDKVGMDAYLGLAMSVAALYPNKVFARSMKLTGSTSAKDYPQAISLATEEPDIFAIKIPPYLVGQKVWLPLAEAKISGCVVLKRDGGWSLVQTGPRPILIKPIRHENR